MNWQPAATLNPPQREAAEHHEGPLLILAGPGSGKTRVVTHRIASMLDAGIAASQILALTFTNKAAEEMSNRVQRLAPRSKVWMGTFHRFGAQLLRQYAPLVGLAENYSILDTEDSRKTLQRAVQEIDSELLYATPQQIGNAISALKSRVVTPDQYQPADGDPLGHIVQQVYPVYQRLLADANAADFDDLLMHPAVMLRDHPELRRQLDERYAYIMVDEYQDTNLAQYAIVRALSNVCANLAVTGDPDQSIYGWRGATISNILEFERDYAEVKIVKLEQNYRSTPSILRAADCLISHNQARKPKRLLTDNPDGPPVRRVRYGNQRDEAEQIAGRIAKDLEQGRYQPQDVAIFYRMNALSRSFEHALRQHAVPYQVVHGQEFYQRKEIKDLLAYLQLVNNPRNDVALLRIINSPPRGIGAVTIRRLREHALGRRLPLLEAARQAKEIPQLKGPARAALGRFVHICDRLATMATQPVHQILDHLLSLSGYLDHLESSSLEEDRQRVANIRELQNAASEFDQQHGEAALELFLEQSALVSDTDEWESESGRVTLMTLHAAKGLEFASVYIVAVEQTILPHERSFEDSRQMEEERRLLFVGITRAKRELQLSYTLRRMTRGAPRPAMPSQFLMELPADELQRHQPPGSYGQPSRFDVDGGDSYSSDEDHFDMLPEDDVSFDFEAFEAEATKHGDEAESRSPSPSPAAVDGETPANSLLTTAAEMLGQARTAQQQRLSPDAFREGMLVRHADHGPGTVVALSGSGAKRKATVQFLQDGCQRSYVLAYSKLWAVASDSSTR